MTEGFHVLARANSFSASLTCRASGGEMSVAEPHDDDSQARSERGVHGPADVLAQERPQPGVRTNQPNTPEDVFGEEQ